MINKVTLIGYTGKDPEVRRLESGAVVAKFSIATTESYKDNAGNWQQQTEWHNIICWKKLAEKAENSLKKGVLVYVEGKITYRTYDDKDGNKRYSTEIVANYFRAINTEKTGSGDVREEAEVVGNESGGDKDDLPF